MKERPILFSGPLVRAILEGRKTQTRRIIKPSWSRCLDPGDPDDQKSIIAHGRYGIPGDRLWVRETWAQFERDSQVGIAYRASCPVDEFDYVGPAGTFERIRINRWRPSIYMPRWASRITLEVTGVRVERVRGITGADAHAEGVDIYEGGCVVQCFNTQDQMAVEKFAALWDSINGKREGASWAANPWVWVVEFRRADGEVQP